MTGCCEDLKLIAVSFDLKEMNALPEVPRKFRRI